MYYLRKEPHEVTVHLAKKIGEDTPKERRILSEDLAVYKHHDFSMFYRGPFNGIDGKWHGMKVYTCKSIKRILALRESTHDYCGEWFDVYDENGKIAVEEILGNEAESCDTCIYNPPSSCDGKPCCFCDTENPLLNCYQRMAEEGEGND